MRLILLALLLVPSGFAAARAQTTPPAEIDNVAAFARLYGVVRYFYPGDAAATLDWDAFAVHGVREVRTATDSRTLSAKLQTLFAPLGQGIVVGGTLPAAPPAGGPDPSLVAWRYMGPGIVPAAQGPYRGKRTNRPLPEGAPAAAAPTGELIEEAPPADGAHVDVDLGSGLKARVPLALRDADARAVDRAGVEAVQSALKQIVTTPDPDLETRLAGVVVAWNVFRHFYPYWSEAAVDWDSRLRPNLELAHRAGTRASYRDALRRLVADVRDGHGGVGDSTRTGRAVIPVRFGLVENQVVVTATSNPDTIPVGAVVVSVGGVPAGPRVSELAGLASGTKQWREFIAVQSLLACDKGATVELSIDAGKGRRTTNLPCDATQPAPEKRPEPISELSPGIWYVDLTRATLAQLGPALDSLSKATGVVFDVRGYPTDAGARVLPYLLDAPETDRWMHVPKIVGPFGQLAGYMSVGWNIQPRTPRIGGKVVFMTDGTAISYAESVMGYVKDRKLATIMGSTTAGANGNVVRFAVPGGMTIGFTGMRVTGHDGKAPFHLVGVSPDIPASPTIRGLREGRDEVLERALAVIRNP